VCQGMPPYKLWEENPALGRIPPQRTDTGCFLIAEVFGASKMIYAKDEDGLYTADPKKDSKAEIITRISLAELRSLDLKDQIVENQARHTQLIAVGAGIRSRHIFAVGLDLGLPTGVLATLSAKDAAQNAYMVSCLLAKHGFVYLEAPFVVQLLPAMLVAARGAVFNGIPPYALWEHPPSVGKLPPHGSDAGSYLIGEVFGALSVIYLKDVDGLYTTDP